MIRKLFCRFKNNLYSFFVRRKEFYSTEILKIPLQRKFHSNKLVKFIFLCATQNSVSLVGVGKSLHLFECKVFRLALSPSEARDHLSIGSASPHDASR